MSRAIRGGILPLAILVLLAMPTRAVAGPDPGGGGPGGGADSSNEGLAVRIVYRGTTTTGKTSEVVYQRYKTATDSIGAAICGDPAAPDLLYVFPNSVSNIYPWFCVPEATPDPPTPDEVLRLIPWPQPRIDVSPAPEGLTGLDTWLWYPGPTSRQVGATLRGFGVSASAELNDHAWATGDGWRAISETAGSRQHPSASHTYNRKGSYTLRLTQTWYPSFVISGGEFGTMSGPLEPQTFVGTRTYPVAEARAVLTRTSGP
jgi:hypothetical protein